LNKTLVTGKISGFYSGFDGSDYRKLLLLLTLRCHYEKLSGNNRELHQTKKIWIVRGFILWKTKNFVILSSFDFSFDGRIN